jgi:UDP-GlcNAc:undecaprenyl-phosphate GlcNAc-1-phosphate transferase
MSAALCAMAMFMSRLEDAILAAAFCGALLGFLRYNFPPASVYLGDSGSMLVGLFISAFAIRSASKEAAAYAFMAAVALLAIPLFDTAVAIIRRRLTGRSIYTVDRGHLHHALMKRGLGPRTALLWFTLLCVTTAAGGFLSLAYQQSEYAFAAILAVVVFLVFGKVFGFAEFQLISNQVLAIIRSFLVVSSRRRGMGQQLSVRLQGSRNWDFCWQVLREFAEKHGLSKLTLDLNLPWIHESYHSTYRQNARRTNGEEEWTSAFPLQAGNRIIGRIDITAGRGQSAVQVLSQMSEVVESLEPYFVTMMQASFHQTPAASDLGAESPDADRQIASAPAADLASPELSEKPRTQMLDVG